MKKCYVIPRTTSVDVVTENDFALTLSNVTGEGQVSHGDYLIIGDGTDDDYTPGATAKGGFWEV